MPGVVMSPRSSWRAADRRLLAASAASRQCNRRDASRASSSPWPKSSSRRGAQAGAPRRQLAPRRGAQRARRRLKCDACPSPAGPQHTRAMHAAGRPGRRTGARGAAPFPPRRSGRRRPRRSDRPRSQSAPPLWGFLKKWGCQGRGVQRGGARRGKRRPKRACTRVRKGPGADRGTMPAPRRAPLLCARLSRWRARASSPLSPMQRPCRGVRCEHKLTAAVSPMALASEAPRHGSVARVPPLSRMESCARAPSRGHARTTVLRRRSPRWAPANWSGLGLASASAAPAGAHARTRARARARTRTRCRSHGSRRCEPRTTPMERAPVRSKPR